MGGKFRWFENQDLEEPDSKEQIDDIVDLWIVAFEIEERILPVTKPCREEGLPNPGVPERRGLITPPLKGGCLFVHSEFQFRMQLSIMPQNQLLHFLYIVLQQKKAFQFACLHLCRIVSPTNFNHAYSSPCFFVPIALLHSL